jgi:mRNA interferase MazF
MNSTIRNDIYRGELWWAELPPVTGSEQGGKRPILIIQNDTGNKFSPTIIAAIITSSKTKAKLPTHVHIPASENGLRKDSIVELEQIKTLDKSCLIERIGFVDEQALEDVNRAILISLGIVTKNNTRRQFNRPVAYA